MVLLQLYRFTMFAIYTRFSSNPCLYLFIIHPKSTNILFYSFGTILKSLICKYFPSLMHYSQGAHLFASQHPWANLCPVFINIEGIATGGPAMLFQNGPTNKWIMDIYKKYSLMNSADLIEQQPTHSLLFSQEISFDSLSFLQIRTFVSIQSILWRSIIMSIIDKGISYQCC